MKKYFTLILAALTLFFTGCHFIASFTDSVDDDNISLTLDKTKTSVSIGGMEVVNLTASKKQNKANIQWLYDESVIFAKTDNYSAVITGLTSGTTTLTAICGSNSASCVINVSQDSYAVTITNPYVYASTDYVDVEPNQTVKISAALFGGTVADIDDYTWTIDKPSVASLSTEGNYCWITGKNDGIAKLTVKHQKAAYGYSVLVNCSSDGTSQTYITTEENILTINLSEDNTSTFKIDLVNPIIEDYASGFEFSVVDSLGNEISSKPVVVSNAVDGEVTLTAYEECECYVRCTHPSAIYSLDVLVRVIKNAETAYIEPSQTLVTVSDSDYENVELSLVNYSGTVETSNFEWSFSDNAEEYLDYTIYNGSSDTTGDKISFKGIKNGSVKITVSYPGVSSRDIVVLIRNITTEAADATTYITTSQNFVKLSLDDDENKISQIYINLKNAENADIKNLHWKITNCASDGSDSAVVTYKTGDGTSSSVSSRAATISSSVNAYCVIEAVNPGTAYIDISHPKALYSTRITVVVSEKSTAVVQKNYLNFLSSASVSVKNGESTTLKVLISGNADSSALIWESEGDIFLASSGSECVITAPASGSGGAKNKVFVSHPDCENTLTFNVTSYDTEEEYEEYAVKSIYSYSTNATVQTGAVYTFYLETSGFSSTPSITWEISEGKDLIDFYTENENKNAIISAKKAGKAVLKASCDGCDDVSFIIEVTDSSIVDVSKTCYLSTSANVLYFSDINEVQNLTVDFFNIDSSSYSDAVWTLSNSDFEISANNEKATITSLKTDSSATLTVSHPVAENTLTIYLKCGSQYEYVNEDSCYISTNNEVFDLYAGQDEVSLVATLNHTEESDSSSVAKGFTFNVEDESIASISYVTYSNICYIKPVKNGTTKITVSHPDADFEKEVVVVVNQSPDSSTIPYITTSSNVITVVQGNYVTASVELKNSSSIDSSCWTWTSEDSKICDVIANNGSSSLLCANAPGTVKIKVSHKDCLYSLNLIVTVLDASVVTDRPYITTSSNIITIKKGSSTTLTAQMVGGTSDADNNYFRFSPHNSSMLLVSSASSSAYVKGLNTGIDYITVYNTRYSSSYSKTVLVVIEDTQEDGVYITASQNIVKLKPDETSQTLITASLVNGEETDGQDFIWWADDYNLVALTSVAEQCSIIPTGRSGTTKVHVKHAKASRQVDIIVMVSNYDDFAFSSNSANITTEKLYFYPLQIPSVEEDYEIKYSSTNEDVCIISGSNSVAWVCGTGYGNASLTAQMVASDGTVIATAEMLVSVSVVDVSKPVVSLGNSILTVEAGTSRTLSATITGDDIEETEKYGLKWSVKNKDNGITLLDENTDKVAYGSDVYVTFNYGGEYVITCEHEESGSYAELYIVVEEKGEITVSLNSNLETVYRDDGSFTLTAELTNGSTSDYSNIEWSCTKQNGLAIVAVSKSKGQKCTVTPKNVGSCSVIAKLPNGNSARCTVIVKASTEISLDLGSLHVIPGYTEVINYKTNPLNATVNWYSVMTSSSSSGSYTDYFTYEDDTAKRQLKVTGIKAYTGGVAGTITAVMTGSSSANLPKVNIYVNYDLEVRLEDTNGSNLTLLKNTCPDTANVKTFNIVYYPVDLDIDILNSTGVMACIPSDGNTALHEKLEEAGEEVSVGDVSKELITEEGITKCRMTVNLVPHTETAMDITVRATLPGDKDGLNTEEKSFYYSAYYDSYDIEVVDLTANGAFTRFEKDSSGNISSLTLGDGEEAVFYFKIKNENAKGTIGEAKYDGNTGTKSDKNYELNPSSKDFSSSTRKEVARKIFEKEDFKLWDEGIYNGTPTQGLISFGSDNSSTDSNTKVYHLAHNWDYYRDLPDEVSGDNWKTYKEENNYSNDFITNLEKKGVKNWLVSAEFIYDDTYALPHPGKNTMSVKWDSSTNSKDEGFYWTSPTSDIYIYIRTTNLIFNNKTVFSAKDPLLELRKKTYSCSWSTHKDTSINLFYNKNSKICIPYVITSSELQNNRVLVCPNDYQSAHSYAQKKSWGFNSDRYDGYYNFPKLLSNYITPTVSKDTNPTPIEGGGTITIPYTDGYGKSGNTKTITVKIEKRMCEAYTNGNWTKQKVQGNVRYVLSEELFDYSTQDSVVPYFDVSKYSISATTAEVKEDSSVLNLDYEVNPSNATVKVTIPSMEEDTGSLELASNLYTSVTTDGTSKVYTVSAQSVSNGIAKGTLCFKSSGTYSGEVIFSASGKDLEESIGVRFDIASDDLFTAQISSQTATKDSSSKGLYSYINEKERMLVLGDGETIKGTIVNLDTSSVSKITDVQYEAFTQSSASSTVYAKDSVKDMSGKIQNDLVTSSITSFNGTYSFTLSHSKDYGYFGANNASNSAVDEFYSKKFTLDDAVIDESSVEYEEVYIEENDERVLDTEATEKNRQTAITKAKYEKLNELKNTYVKENEGKAMSKSTVSYYYDKDGGYVAESKTQNLTPVGHFLISYNTDDTQEIIVYVRVSESPCALTSTYGYEVPQSYYIDYLAK